MATKKKGATSRSGGSGSSGGAGNTLRNVVTSAVGSEALLDLVEKLGIVDIVIGRLKSRLEETDVDELFEEVTDYLKRNPEVLVVSLGAITVATGLLVWLNNRREWDGTERRRYIDSDDDETMTTTTERATTSTGRVRKAS